MKCHPAHDKGFEATIQFTQLSWAYSVLSDTKRRAEYDALLRDPGFNPKLPHAQPLDVDAGRLFIQEMSALASELAESGYDENFIKQALSEEGCPAAIAAAVARGTAPETNVRVEQPTRAEPVTDHRKGGSGRESNYGAPTETRSGSRGVMWAVLSAVLGISALAYFLAYLPYVTAKEEEARRAVTEQKIRAAEAEARLTEARLAEAQAEARETERQGAAKRAAALEAGRLQARREANAQLAPPQAGGRERERAVQQRAQQQSYIDSLRRACEAAKRQPLGRSRDESRV